MPVGLVEIPQLAHLLLERVSSKHPVLGLDHLPDFKRQPREGDRGGVPIAPGVLLPFCPHLVVALADRGLALRDTRSELAVVSKALLAQSGERRNAENGIAQCAD